jgi:hypothetical protein
LSQNQVIAAFFEGALCDIEKSGLLVQTALFKSFGYIGRNRDSGSTGLGGKTIPRLEISP